MDSGDQENTAENVDEPEDKRCDRAEAIDPTERLLQLILDVENLECDNDDCHDDDRDDDPLDFAGAV